MFDQRNNATRHLIPTYLIASTPVRRPIDPDTGEPMGRTMDNIGAWAPRNGDCAAATQFREDAGWGY